MRWAGGQRAAVMRSRRGWPAGATGGAGSSHMWSSVACYVIPNATLPSLCLSPRPQENDIILCDGMCNRAYHFKCLVRGCWVAALCATCWACWACWGCWACRAC